MGVDAGLFAKKSKEFFWFYRQRNMTCFWDFPEDQYNKHQEAENIFKKASDITKPEDLESRGVSSKEMLRLIELNLEATNLTEEPRTHWLDKCKKFVEQRMDDEFMIDTDHAHACELEMGLGYFEVEESELDAR